MKTPYPHALNPDLDLVLERVIDVPPEKVWQGWTDPAMIVKWFTPAPWKTLEAVIDLRPGGGSTITMESPEGQRFPNTGCYLEVIPHERLVFTSALGPGFRPMKPANGARDLPFTGVILLERHGKGTKYTALAIHADIASSKAHAEMGFYKGWGTALDQLVALIKNG